MPSVPAFEKNYCAILRMKQCNVDVPWGDEYERMISGMNFKTAKSPAMQIHKVRTRKRLTEFNDDFIADDDTLETLKERRMVIAEQILGKLGKNTNIESPLFCTWGCQIFLGNDCYINREVSIFDSAPVTIGDRVLIGPGVYICTDTHDVEAADRRKNGGSFALPVKIDDDVWIGMKANIMPGITIGHGSTVAAGATVCEDVEPLCLVGGVPARIIRRLERAEQGHKLVNGNYDVTQ